MPAKSTTSSIEPVAWDVAARVAQQALRLVPPFEEERRLALEEEFAAATVRAQALVEATTGLTSPAGPPRARVFDRFGWVEANIGSFKRLLQPLAERLSSDSATAKRVLSPANRAAAGVEVGLLLAWMSGRVLGQYDLFPFDAESSGDVIYYVGPNIEKLEARHDFPASEFHLWIALHEVTHRLQFTGVPWMREYFLGLVERGTEIEPPDAQAILGALRRAVADIRAGRNPLAEGGVVGLFATSDMLATLREAQALMSLLEGHGDVVMSEAGKEATPNASHFSEVLAQRRASATGASKLVQQALGFDAKLRQYAEGEQFVNAVLETGGPQLLRRVWERPEMLPDLEEIRNPKAWVARVSAEDRASV